MKGARDLVNSERGVIAVSLIVMSGLMVILGRLPASEWLEYTKWIGGFIIASKTVTSAVETMKTPGPELPRATVVKG